MKNSLLFLGIGLIVIGLLKPDISSILQPNNNQVSSCLETCVTIAPEDTSIVEKCNLVIDILQSSSNDNKREDTLRLSSLYADIATLISLDGEDVVVKDTKTIREINSIAGSMLKLNIKDKYPNLAQASREVVVVAIGEDDILLTEDVRLKAVEAFNGLSWAFYEGGK